MAVDVSSRSRQARVRSRARRAEAEAASLARRVDWVLVGAVAALVAYGLRAIDGITHHDVIGNPHYFTVRQAIFAGVGLAALLAFAAIDTDLYRRYGRLIYGGTIGLMAFIFVAGPVTRGSRRWIDVGFFRFQPSGLGKLLFVLFLAGYLADRSRRIADGDRRTTLTAIGLGLVPIGLVFLQPDFGTALVYGAALVGVLFVAGTRWTHLASVAAATVAGALLVLWILPAAGFHLLKPYPEQRPLGFTHPPHDP